MKTAGLTRRAAIGAACVATFGATGVFPRRALAQALRGTLGGALDATDEGLTPGSPDDQSQALGAALQKAALDGRPLFLAPGRYEVAEIALPRNTQIIGVPGASRIVFRGGAFLLRAAHATTLRLEGVTLDGAARPLDPSVRALIDADDVDDLAIDDCLFTGSAAAGAFVRAAAGRVQNSRFETVGTVGLHLRQSRGVTASGNVIADCGDTGILVSREEEGEDGSIVTGNRVSNVRADSGGTGQNGNGINLVKANGVIVAENRVDQCAFSAIRCYSSDRIAVTGNIATNSGEMALYVEFAWEDAIVANNLIEGGNGGISFTNFMQYGGRLATCSGNTVRNIRGGPRYPDGNPQIGAGISAEADVAITGNVIESALWGLKIGWGPYLRDVTASGNVIRDTEIGIGVSVVEGVGPALISNNLISGAKKGAILGMRWEDVATEELLGGEGVAGITLSGNRKT